MNGALMKASSRFAIAAALGLVVGVGSVRAADLGGNCCADLEERIAELEATTARKGNRKMSLTVTGQVHRWGPHPDGVFIEFTLSGTLGGGPVSWRAVDAFDVGSDGLATKRVSFFDPTPIADAANGVT